MFFIAIEWVLEEAKKYSFIKGVVGGLDLTSPDVSIYVSYACYFRYVMPPTLGVEGIKLYSCPPVCTCRIWWSRRGREFESRSLRGVLVATLCDKVCQWLMTSRWFSPDTLIPFTNTTEHHDITEIWLKVALNTITPNLVSAQ
jgi:hypothetical protein